MPRCWAQPAVASVDGLEGDSVDAPDDCDGVSLGASEVVPSVGVLSLGVGVSLLVSLGLVVAEGASDSEALSLLGPSGPNPRPLCLDGPPSSAAVVPGSAPRPLVPADSAGSAGASVGPT